MLRFMQTAQQNSEERRAEHEVQNATCSAASTCFLFGSGIYVLVINICSGYDAKIQIKAKFPKYTI